MLKILYCIRKHIKRRDDFEIHVISGRIILIRIVEIYNGKLHLGCRMGTSGLNTRHYGVYESRALLILNFGIGANGKPYAATDLPPEESSQLPIQYEAGWASESVCLLQRRDT